MALGGREGGAGNGIPNQCRGGPGTWPLGRTLGLILRLRSSNSGHVVSSALRPLFRGRRSEECIGEVSVSLHAALDTVQACQPTCSSAALGRALRREKSSKIVLGFQIKSIGLSPKGLGVSSLSPIPMPTHCPFCWIPLVLHLILLWISLQPSQVGFAVGRWDRQPCCMSSILLMLRSIQSNGAAGRAQKMHLSYRQSSPSVCFPFGFCCRISLLITQQLWQGAANSGY